MPTGHNPTGIVMSEERKRALYSVCQKHSLVIIEDDAYYWLQFYRRQREQQGGAASLPQQGQAPRQEPQPLLQVGAQRTASAASEPASASEPTTASEPASASSSALSLDMDGVPGLDLPASFLSIDTDGRVVRVDTLSKLMGPG